jgi:predicted DNA-binding transcriptional regulator AlpA
MARGWESKSVESQQEAAEAGSEKRAPLSALEQEIQALQLSRTHVLHEMAAGSNPRFRELKQRALLHLDAEIARLRNAEPHE